MAARSTKAVGAILAPGHGTGLVDRDRRLGLIVFLHRCHGQSRRGTVDVCDGDRHDGRVACLIGKADVIGAIGGEGKAQVCHLLAGAVPVGASLHGAVRQFVVSPAAVVGRSDRFTRIERHNSLIGGIRAAHFLPSAVIALDHLIDLWRDLIDDGDPVERYRCALAVGGRGGEFQLAITLLVGHGHSLRYGGDGGDGGSILRVFDHMRVISCGLSGGQQLDVFARNRYAQTMHRLVAEDMGGDIGIDRLIGGVFVYIGVLARFAILHATRRRPADGQLRRLGVDAGDGCGRTSGVARLINGGELHCFIVRCHILILAYVLLIIFVRRSSGHDIQSRRGHEGRCTAVVCYPDI